MAPTFPSAESAENTDIPRFPAVILFDVNETLSDMSPMAQRFLDVGAPAQLAATWFATLLRDGFALTAAGAIAPFAQLGIGALRANLHGVLPHRAIDEAVAHIMEGFGKLPVHKDVIDGIPILAALDTRLVTLSNGATTVAQSLFERAGIGEHFEQLLSAEDAGVWNRHQAPTLTQLSNAASNRVT